MKNTLFKGVCTAMVTPFLNGDVNYPMMEQLLLRQMQAGIHAVVIAGTTGEAPTLTDEEKLELFRRSKTFVKNQCKIIAGTGSNCTSHAVRLSKQAEKAGADALLVVSPYYNKATPEGLYQHYKAIAESVSIPVILYNVPSRTGVDIPVSVCWRLSKIPNIAGIKEASPDLRKITKIIRNCGPHFSVWSGNDDLTVPIMALGGRGVVSVTANLLPREMVDMTDAALDGDFDTAADLQCQLQPVNELLFSEVNPIPIKAAMKRIGYDCGSCRLPLTDLTEKNQKILDQFFK